MIRGIGDTAGTRRAPAPEGGIARAGLRTFIAKRAFLGLLLFAWLPFIVRAVQFYAASNLSSIQQASLLTPSADTLPVPRAAADVCLLRHCVLRRRADCQRPPRESAPD